MGRLREPPSPFFSHQSLVLRLPESGATRRTAWLGRVAIAPLDVVLDNERALILQPDVLFISTPRLSIIRDQVWGPPDLVAEIVSHGTEKYDRGKKLKWYRQYGVRECWIVNGYTETVTVVDFAGPSPVIRTAKGVESIRSTVLPDLQPSAADVLG
jgi:Uma2 family endonuclease